ncbi:MAG: hypothetical protein NTV21_04625 [Planctomycetota bacterium]|nr:hypothetical protein [Planctomycetota bacterium]
MRFYLSSLDSYLLEPVRECEVVAFKRFDTGKECAVVRLDPPIPGNALGVNSDVVEVVLAARHEGDTLSKLAKFPCFVHVARPLTPDVLDRTPLRAKDLENFGWGEVYRTHADALNHVFDERR